jgi:hypothetical protein
MDRIKELIEQKEKKEPEIVKTPEKFDGTVIFVTYKKALINYVGTIKGVNGAPLEYAVRQYDQYAEPDEGWLSKHQRMVESTPHQGDAFAEVWAIIESKVIDGPAAYHIPTLVKERRDGHAAFQALLSHYEGSAMLSKAKLAAYQDMRNLRYEGECPNFTFETYVTRHTKAHQILEEYGEHVPETKKSGRYKFQNDVWKGFCHG